MPGGKEKLTGFFSLGQTKPEHLRKPRLGAFEIMLCWQSAEGGSRQQVVLFSKLNTLRFPNPPDVVGYLVRTLAPARSTRFTVYARALPGGLGCLGAHVKAQLDGQPDARPMLGEVREETSDKDGRVVLNLPFGAFAARAAVRGDGQLQMSGQGRFEVKGSLLRNVCIPVSPPVPLGQIRIVCTWAEFPHAVAVTVKTPLGVLSTDESGDGAAVPHARVECSPREGGFGPISLLVEKLVEGRYHVFCSCVPYTVGDTSYGWQEANAQVTLFGVGEAEQPVTFSRMQGETGGFWDVCFLEVAPGGAVSVREFNALAEEMPGNCLVAVAVRDMAGLPVAGAKVTCLAAGGEEEAAREERDLGETGADGTLECLLQLGDYTVAVTAGEYMRSTANLRVDLQPQVAGLTVPMVKSAYFQGSSDVLCILSWAGDAQATLNVETPCRYLARAPADEPFAMDPSRPMCMRGNNPVGALITAADPNICGGGFADFVWVECVDGMDRNNMQLSVFTKDGLTQTLVRPLELGDTTTGFWAVGELIDGVIDVENGNERVAECPARGKPFHIRTFPAVGEELEYPIAAEVVVSTQDGERVRHWLGPPKEGSPHHSQADEFPLFLPFGTYNFEAVDERWHSPLVLQNIHFNVDAVPSIGLCMVDKSKMDAKTAYITLSWAGAPSDLDLCIRSHDGTVTSQNKTESKATAIKGIKYENAATGGFGPKVLSLLQPIVGKFRLYVVNRSGEAVPLPACTPQVNIVLFTGVWRSFQIPAEQATAPAAPVWHVADLKVRPAWPRERGRRLRAGPRSQLVLASRGHAEAVYRAHSEAGLCLRACTYRSKTTSRWATSVSSASRSVPPAAGTRHGPLGTHRMRR